MPAVRACARPFLSAASTVFILRSSSLFETRRLFSHGAGNAPLASDEQVYTIPTHDAAFKWILNLDNVRQSFFRWFIPGSDIRSSQRLDDSMNPVKHSQLLRQFLHDKGTTDTVKKLKSRGAYVVLDPVDGNGPCVRDERATVFLNEIVRRLDSIKGSLPRPQYDGKMDFACVLSNGDYALVEMQVMRENHWDRRALAYVSSFYGNQLAKGGNWKDLRKVIGINILGGGIHNRVPWPDTPNHFMRHYKFEDQLNGKGRFIDGIELFQYSIVNSPIDANQGLSDWMKFLRNAHNMTEEDVLAEIKTPEVLEAFERAKISKLPAEVRTAYEAQDKNFERYSQQTEDLMLGAKLEGKLEGKLEAAEKMMQFGVDLDFIQACTGLSLADIEGIKRKGC